MIDKRLNQMRRRHFVRHAHPAMQLHRLLTDETRRLTDPRLRRGNRAAAFVRVIARVARSGQIRDRTRLLGVDQHLDHAMLQRLEPRDRRAELLPLLRVLDRRVIQRVEHADGFGAQQERRVIGNVLKRGGTRALALPSRRAGVPVNVSVAARWPSIVRYSVTSTFAASRATTNNAISPSSRAGTIQ